MLATFFYARQPTRLAVIAWLTAAQCVAAPGIAQASETGVQHLKCTNEKSGASWEISVDLDHAQVDGQKAMISDTWISWADPKQGYYDLERATGKLQFRNPSSTGGYFLNYACRPV